MRNSFTIAIRLQRELLRFVSVFWLLRLFVRKSVQRLFELLEAFERRGGAARSVQIGSRAHIALVTIGLFDVRGFRGRWEMRERTQVGSSSTVRISTERGSGERFDDVHWFYYWIRTMLGSEPSFNERRMS